MSRSPAERTRDWVLDFVIGQGLCPFARKEIEAGSVGLHTSPAQDAEAAYRDMLAYLAHFMEVGPEEESTGLLVFPDALPDFLDFNDFIGECEAAIEQAGLTGEVQLIGFHPGYRFADAEGEDDPANYTNRSPHPMIHLLRESSMDAAIAMWKKAGLDTAIIPERNKQRLREMGLERASRFVRGV